MDATLQLAYGKLWPSTDLPIADWLMAEAILERFSVRVLGECLAKECIFRIVNHLEYPSQDVCTRIVLRAEGFASELWDDLPDEPHMAELERKEYQHFYTKDRVRAVDDDT